MTIRNWTQRYHEFLSDSAAPAPGMMRRFTEHDRVIIGHIAQMVADGARHEHIAERLRESPITDAEVLPPTSAEPDATVAPVDATDDQHAALVPFGMPEYLSHLARNDGRLSDAEQRITRLESSQANTLHVVTAFFAGLIIMGLVIVAVLMLVQ